MVERTGEAFEMGEELTVLGSKLLLGAAAPEFVLDRLDPAGSAIHSVHLSYSGGQVRLLQRRLRH